MNNTRPIFTVLCLTPQILCKMACAKDEKTWDMQKMEADRTSQ